MHAIRTALAAAILAALALPALAQAPAGPALVAQYGDWGVYVSQAARTKICYALSQPKDRLPATLKRDPGYFFVSTRPGENVKNEVSIIAGFRIKDGSDAIADIGGTAFTLYTRTDSAWVRNVAEEARLVDTLRRSTRSDGQEHVGARQRDHRQIFAQRLCPGPRPRGARMSLDMSLAAPLTARRPQAH